MIRSIFKQSWESVVSPEEEKKFTVEVFQKRKVVVCSCTSISALLPLCILFPSVGQKHPQFYQIYIFGVL